MKINEAVARAMATNERAFKDISETQATRIVKLALAEIAKEIDELSEGKVSIPGFASFTAKQVEREKDGEKSARKRITVRLKARKAEDESEDADDEDGDED
jgi:nucleoid DNA-binding protein